MRGASFMIHVYIIFIVSCRIFKAFSELKKRKTPVDLSGVRLHKKDKNISY